MKSLAALVLPLVAASVVLAQTSRGGPPPVTNPEPSSFVVFGVLMAIGIGWYAFWRRRRVQNG